MLGWNGAAVVLAIAAWRASALASLRRWVRALWALALVPLAAAPASVAAAYFRVRGVIAGESIDPSHKARVLAETISEALNLSALLVLVGFVPFWLAVGASVIAHRRRKRAESTG